MNWKRTEALEAHIEVLAHAWRYEVIAFAVELRRWRRRLKQLDAERSARPADRAAAA
jgi:hypothetical protein